MGNALRDNIPTFGDETSEAVDVDLTNWSALTSTSFARSWGVKLAGVRGLFLGREARALKLIGPLGIAPRLLFSGDWVLVHDGDQFVFGRKG